MTDVVEEAHFEKALELMEKTKNLFNFDEILGFIQNHCDLTVEEILCQLNFTDESDATSSSNDSFENTNSGNGGSDFEELQNFHSYLIEDVNKNVSNIQEIKELINFDSIVSFTNYY